MPERQAINVKRQASEHEIQAQIVGALRAVNLGVRETTAFRQKGPSGVDRGIPDLLVFCKRIPGVYIGIEVKRPNGRTSRDQQDAIDAGEYEVAQNAEGALMIVRDRLTRLLNADCDPIRRIDSFLYAMSRSGHP